MPLYTLGPMHERFPVYWRRFVSNTEQPRCLGQVHEKLKQPAGKANFVKPCWFALKDLNDHLPIAVVHVFPVECPIQLGPVVCATNFAGVGRPDLAESRQLTNPL